MKLIYSNILFGIVLGVALTACSSDSSGSSCDPVHLGLEGTWQSSSCEMVDTQSYRNTTIVFGTSDITISHEYYTDEICSIPDASVVSSPITGTYTTGCSVTTNTGVTAFELDMVADADGLTYMEIVHVDGNTMYVSGDPNTSTRPQTLDFNKTYTRQP